MGLPETTTCYGDNFTRRWTREIPYLGMQAALFVHRCGLEVISVESDDCENVFMAGFQTEGQDDRGIPHIVEHVVLGGSKNYSVKDPSEEMTRGSLATYINAETYQNYTLYPYASVNRQDFLNGVRIYLDAVLNPLLLRETFMQEGWHYEFGDGGLTTTGIVLNERRAQLYDVMDFAMDVIYRELYQGHPLAFDTGGRPGAIETLSYDAFVSYYQSHYTLSKTRLFFFGNIGTADKLACVDQYLTENCSDRLSFTSAEEWRPQSPAVPVWQSPRRVDEPILPTSAGSGDENCAWCMSWHLGKMADPTEQLGMELVSMLLLEDDGSPLRRTLMESGLCEDLMDFSPFDSENSECMFVVGAIGCKRESLDELKVMTLDCLERYRRDGFEPEHLKATFKQLRLRYQEVKNGYGLAVGRLILRNWLNGKEPLGGLDYRISLTALQETLKADDRYLEKLLEHYLLGNQHRVEIRFIADEKLATARQAAEEKHLKHVLSHMGQAERKRIEAELEALRQYQQRSDGPEVLASFPRLQRHELPVEPFHAEVMRRVLPCGTVMLRTKTASSGVNYLKLAYDITMFSDEEQSLLPIFVCVMEAVGVQKHPYDDVERMLGLAGAELDIDLGLENVEGGQSQLGILTLKLRALSDSWKEALDCLSDRIHRTVFTEKKRIRELLRQCWSQACQKLRSDDEALDYAMACSAAGLSSREDINERWYGVAGVRRLREAMRQLRGRGTALQDMFAEMARKLDESVPQTASYVGDDAGYDKAVGLFNVCRKTAPWRGLPEGESLQHPGRREIIPNGKRETCCARSFKVFSYDNPLWAGLYVYAELLSEGYLVESIRLRGGAYGGGCSYYPWLGLFQMYSYRDPQPQATFRTFDEAVGRVENWSEEQITGAIIACIRNDMPLKASECCSVSLAREIISLSHEQRRIYRRQLLAVTRDDVMAAAAQLKILAADGWNDCVAGDARRLAKMNFHTVSWPR